MLSFLLLLACAADPEPADTTPAGEESDADADADTDADADADTDDSGGQATALLIEQIQVSGDGIGESALIIGPDGTSVLLDVAGESHTDAVLAALDHHLGQREVDWLVLTHWHRDHIGGLAGLIGGESPELSVRQGIVTRGLVDLDDRAAHPEETAAACAALSESAVPQIALCDGPKLAPCDLKGSGRPWPASRCDGLLLGDLSDAADDSDGLLAHILLGEGAALRLYWVNGWLATDAGLLESGGEGVALAHDHFNEENARSMGGFVRYGDFLYLFGGDLTGGGSGTPAVEQLIAATGDDITDGGQVAMPSGLADVLHVNHHGHRTATSSEWVDWAMPDDGQPRTAIVGANQHYLGAVDQEVLDRLHDRLAGGEVWITEDGQAEGTVESEHVVDASVLLTVTDGGARYTVSARSGETLSEVTALQSTVAVSE